MRRLTKEYRTHCQRPGGDGKSRNEAIMLRIVPAQTDPALSQARNLFREYARIPGVAPCVADFEREVVGLPGLYAPSGGRLLLAIQDNLDSGGEAVGCGALRPFDLISCEMKRLYVRPTSRGQGAGRELVKGLIAEARSIGYERMLLDTLPSMAEAQKLYRVLGFREISSYQKNPVPGSLFFELLLK
jgi:putative acetyltransferase